ncbi:enoyl-CoA hydratase-related protein [Halobacillus shinanisalinarum]|uniref:Enoyl-CoA hydratase-related protein n=1 Tax=Halobacillus shinanisalinarum TaxID=2932258 RepID=A0ABY4H3U3_9BACI|nr:enoyl-CoA hydratase-related protein [Halobacillus shinanisalinarum]UOQ95126.1 enoyl-CoA hydratase-related protein [Halobacillus shinanisalinarum]
MSSNIKYIIEYNIGYVSVNRPEVLNCFDYKTLTELQEIIDMIHINQDIKTVIFTGEGTKAFSAGIDLKERKSLSEEKVRRNVKAIRELFNSIADLPIPTIAAVNGYALGGGFEWLLSCDFAIAVEEAMVGLTETSWAITPGAGGTQRLPRIIGAAKAKELIFTAKKLTASEALDLGIFLTVVPRPQLKSTCEALATDIVQNGPVALAQAKYAIDQGMNTDLQTGLAIESKSYELTIPTQDRIEALNAFSERRPSQFKGC